MTRMAAAVRKQQIIDVATRLAVSAQTRTDLTAAKVAASCGISETMLWRLASPEFRAIRNGLPGGAASEGLVTELRSALREARAEAGHLRAITREHEDCPTKADVLAIVELNERLEQDNRSLRTNVNDLKARLAAAEHRGPGKLIDIGDRKS
jgi:AcrR family transcriptional regulator